MKEELRRKPGESLLRSFDNRHKNCCQFAAFANKRFEILRENDLHGDKLAHEHIYWDQASVLVQLGLLDPARLPVAGIETARKVLDNTLPSNALMQRAGPLE